MKSVNLIYYNNGVGLTKHSQIIDNILEPHFKINHVDILKKECPKSNINFFIQNVDINSIEFLFCSDINIMIPTIEWVDNYCLNNLHLFDFIFATTKECFNYLNKLHPNVIYTGFSSIDRYNSCIVKKPTFFHNSGKSMQKNTELVVDIFNKNGLPITIVDATSRFLGKVKSNINYIPLFIEENDLNKMYNENLFHICCSINEGWGHYIYEALSCCSVIITSDAPPINENLTDKECFLIKCDKNNQYINNEYISKKNNFPFRFPNYVIREELERCIDFVKNREFSIIKKSAREKYNTICNSFEKTFKDIVLSL